MKQYKRSYAGFIILILLFLASIIGLCTAVAVLAPQYTVRVGVNIMAMWLMVFAFVIYKTENIYWINGVEYPEAFIAGSERRKRFARRHLKRFGIAAAVTLCLSLLMTVIGADQWIDFTLGVVIIISTAISTVKIKL